jgi:thioredoxin-related protein
MIFTDGCCFCREKGKKDGKQKRKTRPTLHQDINNMRTWLGRVKPQQHNKQPTNQAAKTQFSKRRNLQFAMTRNLNP